MTGKPLLPKMHDSVLDEMKDKVYQAEVKEQQQKIKAEEASDPKKRDLKLKEPALVK